MFHLPLHRAAPCLLLLSSLAHGQAVGLGNGFSNLTSLDPAALFEAGTNNGFLVNSQDSRATNVQTPDDSISYLDLKAPGKARGEYDKGYQLLLQKDLQGAEAHLTNAIAIYPNFVAAHNALGTAYLDLGQSEKARNEFDRAVTLDDHRPNSYLNLGSAEVALKQFPAAEESVRKASSLAPLDLQLQLALAHAEFLNQDYPAVIAVANQVHAHKHEGVAAIHFFAAGAWGAQGNLSEAQREMETLLQEEPKSPSRTSYLQVLKQMKAEQARLAEFEQQLIHSMSFDFIVFARPTPTSSILTKPFPNALACKLSSGVTGAEATRQAAQLASQEAKEEKQIEEAEAAPDPTCSDCAAILVVESPGTSVPSSRLEQRDDSSSGVTFHASVDEVAAFFAATDHGKSVTDLAVSDLQVRDDRQPPGAILGFRNESELPLRLGLVIDTSESVNGRFTFEQAAAAQFLQSVLVRKDDLAFVVGFNNSILLDQDFTADQELTTRAVKHLAPGGGTAVWDAVAFAAAKLASRPEVQPVARMLVVISDGEDNSSSTTLKRAIETAQSGQVAVYTVSTSEELKEGQSTPLGDHALRTLAELTGGTAFLPGSVGRLNASLADLQQVIRGRYLISYKPASFQRDGHYRTLDIKAQKEGHKLKVFARKGYYASAEPLNSAEP